MSYEIACDACAEVRASVDVETLEAATPLRDRPHDRPPRFNFCRDRSGCREASESWKAEVLPQLRGTPTFGEWLGEDPADLVDYYPLTPDLVSRWFEWVRETGQEHDLFDFVGQALRTLLQAGAGRPGEEDITQADLPAANAVAQALELGLCTLPDPDSKDFEALHGGAIAQSMQKAAAQKAKSIEKSLGASPAFITPKINADFEELKDTMKEMEADLFSAAMLPVEALGSSKPSPALPKKRRPTSTPDWVSAAAARPDPPKPKTSRFATLDWEDGPDEG